MITLALRTALVTALVGMVIAIVAGAGPDRAWSAGADPDAFHVAPDGNDENPGTLSAPFATLERAQAALRASAASKTVYLRAGIYQRREMFRLTAADNGQTWSHFPGDGYNTAVLDASDMTFSSCGNTNVILIQGGNKIRIDGLTIRNFKGGGGITIHGGPAYPDVRARGCYAYGRTGPAQGNTIANNVIHDLGDGADNVYPWGWFAGIAAWGDVRSTTISNNVVHDVGGIGISLGVLQMGPRNGIDGSVIGNNAVFNTNRAPSAGDLGGYYVIDRTGSSTGVVIANNYLRDYGDPTRRIKGLYLDDGVSNVTVEGNVVTGSGTFGAQIHSGNRNRFTGNIFDLGDTGRQWALLYQNSAGRGNMVGNVFENNLIVGNFANADALQGNVYFSGNSPNGFVHPAVSGNIYWNQQAGGSLPHQGEIADISPAIVDPRLSRPTYRLGSQSPVYALPSPFPRQPATWGEPGFWGPPGYVIPGAD